MLALLATVAGAAFGQTVPAASAGGQGELAFQGNYVGGASAPFLNITGIVAHAQEFVPGLGFLTCELEGYASQNQFAAGENFVELRGAPWLDHYWTVTGGDFRVPTNLVEFPFTNVFTPELDGRGFKAQAEHGANQYTFFVGEQTLTAGTRVAYRVVTPENVLGASAVRSLMAHLQTGVRAMQFSTSPQAILDNPYLFPPGRTVPLVSTLAWQTSYTPVERLKIYTEVSRPLASDGERTITSMSGGFAWEGAAFSFKADYMREGVLYYPLAGYFAGDRQGPFGEARWRPRKAVELYGSASRYRNNLEGDLSLPSLTSVSTSAGASAALPGSLSASVSVSTLQFTESTAGQSAVTSNNQQIGATLSRAIGRHTLHAAWREIRLDTATSPQRQQSWELGDTYQSKHFSLGGSARYQQVSGIEDRSSLFVQGLAQAAIWRITAYGNLEVGNDLANQTLFSTSAYRTSVIGVAVRLARGWNLQTEMYRNLLNLTINPESIFLLQNGGALAGASPAAVSLAATSKWSFYFRLSKQIRWGAGLPAEKFGQTVVRSVALAGAIEGMVRIRGLDGTRAASGIPVILDGSRTAVSGADGSYLFDNVGEGSHRVALALAELPADFDAGDNTATAVTVQPRRAARADFEVLPLGSVGGSVQGPEGVALGGILIRMVPGNRYTTTGEDGTFHFYNVREGKCVLALDGKSLPEGGTLVSAATVDATVSAGGIGSPINFQFTVAAVQKPIRKVLEINR